jgi:hypothetical protein
MYANFVSRLNKKALLMSAYDDECALWFLLMKKLQNKNQDMQAQWVSRGQSAKFLNN